MGFTPKETEAIKEAIRFMDEAANAIDQADSCLRSAGIDRDVTTKGYARSNYLTAQQVYSLIQELKTEATIQAAEVSR
jgi:hypothetical protein